MPFEAYEVSISLVRSLRLPLDRIEACDGPLNSQIRRAAASVPLNLLEGGRRVGKDRLHLWRIAAGSAAEVRAALKVAEAFGYLGMEEIGEPLAFVDRVLAMLWRMTR